MPDRDQCCKAEAGYGVTLEAGLLLRSPQAVVQAIGQGPGLSLHAEHEQLFPSSP